MRSAVREALDGRASGHGAGSAAWEQVTPELRLRKLPGCWSVQYTGCPPVDLTKHEAGIFGILLEAAGKPIAMGDLARRIYDRAPGRASNALQIAISRLRQKLGEDGAHPRHLLTLPGFGYLWRP